MQIVWDEWFDRWEAMQDAYVPDRRRRFGLMLEIAAKATDGKLDVLDLGAGPGSVAFHVVARRPGTAVLAIDSNNVLLELGGRIAEQRHADVDFRHADLRCLSSLDGLEQRFDVVLSATALHWLGEQHLREVYARSRDVLRPGGWFVNSDHIASDDQSQQAHNMSMLRKWQERAFSQGSADTWDSFWQHLATALGARNTEAFRGVEGVWEGTEEGLPERWHVQALEGAGFAEVSVLWRRWGDAVVAARKP